jgi:hypothetical protein
LDTYYRRIQQFLNERNVSVISYERINITNNNLQKDIDVKVADLRDSQHQELLNINNGQELRRGCQQSCCWSERKMKQFYNGEKDRSPTFLDRLSQIDIKLLADVHYGKLPVPDGIQLPKLTHEILPCLQNNTIIFVDTTDLDTFFQEIHEKISVNYILITGDSDVPCPLQISGLHTRLLNGIFAGKTRIIHWFAMNCDLGNNKEWKKSNIFSCIPQGINHWYNLRYYMQLASGKDDSIYNTELKTNDYWVLTSFTIKHAPEYRKPLWDLSCHGRLKNISKCLDQVIDQWRFYIHIGRSRFVFSPPGVGVDCGRTWEALYLGSIPIVLSSPINSIFQNLPVLIVNNYEEINLELLKNVYNNMTKEKYDYRRLYKGYWQREIHHYRNSSEIIQIHYTSSKQ